MNYIKHLAGFFERVATDERLNPTHISMYVSLFQFWNSSRFKNPISISRNELMKVSKISAKATYHKCIKQLNDFGYLKYKPSYNPYKGSLIYLFDFQADNITKNETGTEQVIVRHHTKIETGTEQAVVPYINNINIKNKTLKNLGKQNQKNDVQKMNELGKKEKGCAKKESEKKSVIPSDSEESPPSYNKVLEYFSQSQYPEEEAKKFFNYFQSNGWLVGGRAKMKDWRAAANNWILNADKFSGSKNIQPKSKNLMAITGKNYAEPL